MPEQSVAVNWSNETTDVSFFVAMVGYKPVGVGKHFQMLLIHDKFCRLTNKEIPTRVLWDRLDEMYDLEALDTSEISPFPNSRTRDFELPDDEFGELIAAKKNTAGSGSEEDDEEEDSEEDLESETAESRQKDGAGGQTASRPAATGGKTGKGDWTPAKASPVPTALAKANKQHKGGSSSVDCVPDASPSPASSTKSSTPAPETAGSDKRPGTSSGGKDKDGGKTGASDVDKKDNSHHQQQQQQQQQAARRSTAKDSKLSKDSSKDEKESQQQQQIKKETSTSARRTADLKSAGKAASNSSKDDEPSRSTKRVSDVRKEHVDRRSRASSATDQDSSKDSASKDNGSAGSKDNGSGGGSSGGNAGGKGDSVSTPSPASKLGVKAKRESRRPDSLSSRREPMRRRSRSRNVSPAASSTGSKRTASPATNPGRRNSSPSTTSTKRTASPALPATKASASPAATASASRKRATRSDVSSPANVKRARAR